MPLQRVIKDGLPGYRWGDHGKVYVYLPNDPYSREKAKEKAEAQGRAARASGYKDK